MKNLTSVLLIFISIYSYGQSPKRAVKKLGSNPVIFIDSINILQSDLQNYDPDQIAIVTIIKDQEAKDILGEDGKDGVVYIETIPFAKKRYWKFFRTKSSAYADLFPDVDSDSTVQYILNTKVLGQKGFEGNLASIDDEVFKEISIVDKVTLEKQYGVTNKIYGVLIVSDVPKNLHNGKKMF